MNATRIKAKPRTIAKRAPFMHPLSWALRIFTPTGFPKEDVLGGAHALDLGCGARKLPGATGIDALALPGVDIVHDLSKMPWPIEDGAFDLVLANHFLEHADDTIRTLGEMHRVLAPQGRAVIQVPYFRSTDAFADPTHRRFFTSASLDYVIKGTKVASGYAYAPYAFRQVGFWYGWPHPSANPIAQAFKNYIHAHRGFYDQRLSLLAPVKCVTWELERS